MKELKISYPGPNPNDPEMSARWVYSQIGEMLQRIEWIGKLNNERAKLGVFDEPMWAPDERRRAKRLRNIYAHDFQRIDRNGVAHFYNKDRKKGPKGTKRTLPQMVDDWMNMHVLVHEILVGYIEATLECQTCGTISRGKEMPHCGHCVPLPKRDEGEPVLIKPAGASLSVSMFWGRADQIDEFINDRTKSTMTDAGWQTMMETGELPAVKATSVAMGDGIISDEQKANFLREARPIAQQEQADGIMDTTGPSPHATIGE